MTEAKALLAAQWRERAEQLESYARRCRRAGDPGEAEDAEQAAVEYVQAAEELELGALRPGEPA